MIIKTNIVEGGRQSRRIAVAKAFSMVELLVAMTLLSLIVLALMAVFSNTETAFRSSVTQSDILEGGRAAMDMMANDLRAMVPSDGNYNTNNNFYVGTYISSNAVNFCSQNNSYAACSYGPNNGPLLYYPMQQRLPGSSSLRVNALNYFFILGRQNTKWTGVGYIVDATNLTTLYPLYRFYAETNISYPPVTLYWAFVNAINQSQWTNMSHVMNGVVHMTVHPYNEYGNWMTNYYQFLYVNNVNNRPEWITNQNSVFLPPYSGEVGFFMFSNAIPSAVEVQLGVIEDRTLQRAVSFPTGILQSNYLSGQAGHVEIFRQRVTIPNVDLTAYQ